MGKQKVFMIVTNDKYETPVAMDILGRQAVADFFGITLDMLWRAIKNDKWKGEYKAVDLGFSNEIEDFEPNKDITPLTKEERAKKVAENKQKKHELSIERMKASKSDYYRLNRRREIERNKKNYRRKKEERWKERSLKNE